MNINSPSSWMKNVSIGGELAPFFKSVCVYFVALGVGGEGAPSLRAAACKCAPVLCLLAALLYRARGLPPDRRRYAALVGAGLALSALGDALLVWPERLVAGMGAFAAAHVAYIAAFGRGGRARAGVGAALYAGAAGYAAAVGGAAPAPLRAPVAAYAVLLATMAWRGSGRPAPAALGAALFLVSDAILGYRLFVGPVPHGQVLVMSTYYMAQFGIAYSALHEPAAAPAAVVTTSS